MEQLVHVLERLVAEAAAGMAHVDELVVVIIVAEQERADVFARFARLPSNRAQFSETVLKSLTISKRFCEYFRCPERYGSFALEGPLSQEFGYFRFGENTLFARHLSDRSNGITLEARL